MAKGKSVSNGLDWHKSGAFTPDKFPKQKCMSAKQGNALGPKAKMNTAHGVVPVLGKHGQLQAASNALGSSVRAMKNTLTQVGNHPIGGSGAKHSKDLG